MRRLNEHRIRQLFYVGLFFKGLDGVLECAGGIVLAFISTNAIVTLSNQLTQSELIEDPHDFIATYLVHFASTFSVSSQHFFAFYLFIHGAIKVGLVAGLLLDKLWAYPVALVLMGLFDAYQLYRISYTHSLGLAVLTVLDVIIIVLIWHEWGVTRRRRGA
jgi:uncharacterized membrane protein